MYTQSWAELPLQWLVCRDLDLVEVSCLMRFRPTEATNDFSATVTFHRCCLPGQNQDAYNGSDLIESYFQHMKTTPSDIHEHMGALRFFASQYDPRTLYLYAWIHLISRQNTYTQQCLSGNELWILTIVCWYLQMPIVCLCVADAKVWWSWAPVALFPLGRSLQVQW